MRFTGGPSTFDDRGPLGKEKGSSCVALRTSIRGDEAETYVDDGTTTDSVTRLPEVYITKKVINLIYPIKHRNGKI